MSNQSFEISFNINISENSISEYTPNIFSAEIENGVTDTSLCYVAKKADDLKSLQREMRVTAEIENKAGYSVVIPFLTSIAVKGNNYGILQYKKNGLFLNDLITHMDSMCNFQRFQTTIDLAIRMLESMSHIHQLKDEEGYFMLDVHPGNIFVENADISRLSFGSAKYIDFEYSVKIEDGIADLPSGKRWKSGSYTAPEITDSYGTHVTAAADIYSIGAIFYRMIFGEEYDDEMRDTIDDISSVLSYKLVWFLKTCLDMDPNYRFQNTREALDELLSIRECISDYEQKKYYELFQFGYTRRVPQEDIYGMSYEENAFLDAVRKIADATSVEETIGRSVDYYELKYIFNGLWDLKRREEKEGRNIQDEVTISRLIASGIFLATHTHDDNAAWDLLREFDSNYKDQIHIADFLKISLHCANVYVDRYKLEDAAEYVGTTVEILEMQKENEVKMARKAGKIPQESIYAKDLGESYSSYGCQIAYGGIVGQEAMVYFRKAIEEFGKMPVEKADKVKEEINFTSCHIMHYAVDQNNKDLYMEALKAIPDYIKGNTWTERYRNVSPKADNFDPYRLWIMMKGLLHFGKDEMDDELYDEILTDLRNGIYNTILAEHVRSLILRYIGEIIFNKENRMTEDAEAAFEASIKGFDPEKDADQLDLLKCINYHTRFIYYQKKGDADKKSDLMEQLKKTAENAGWTELAKKLKGKIRMDGVFRFEMC